ncbi:MAG: hypothetical protein ABEK50_12390 [bacterium]
MSEEGEDELPEASPRSDIDHDKELEVEGGTLVWRDPVASGDPVRTAYVWPLAIIALIITAIIAALV